jgi:two-component system CheB/CheR fusion protein
VDDAPEVVTTCQTLLEMHGAVVACATSGRQALDMLAENDIDVLISDISMPGMNGYELLSQVRALPGRADLPAIAVSGLGRESDVAQARAGGFNAHLGKPLSIERLIAIIHDLLPARQADAAQ